jgi:hypothetical protein
MLNREDTRKALGHILDRDEMVEEAYLASAWKRTADKWKVRLTRHPYISRLSALMSIKWSSLITLPQSFYGAPYTTSGLLVPDASSSMARFATKIRVRPRTISIEKRIDYDNPVIYAAIDSALSQPCERNSVAVINDSKHLTKRLERSREYESARGDALSQAKKGKIELTQTLMDKLKDLPPSFISRPVDDGITCGREGYLRSRSGLIFSANHFDGKVLSSCSVGMGLVGSVLASSDRCVS